MGLVIARFINGNAGSDIAQAYRENFKPSEHFQHPEVMLSISILCADTEEKASQMRKLMDYRLLQFEKGNFEKPSNYESIKSYNFSPAELERIRFNAGRVISGTKEQI
ncbi:MAG: LLM class flavin-dependent oxidoreductase, partial [Ginsengibacter sp.]